MATTRRASSGSMIIAVIFFFARTTALSSTSNPNQLLCVDSLGHSYCALRHGQSLANTAKIISSDPAISTVQHGLSEFGHQQVQESAIDFAKHVLPLIQQHQYCGVALVSSDFKRAKETAQHFANACIDVNIPLYQDKVILETRLRERNFGELNGGSDSKYQDVWDIDITNPHHTTFGVEPVYSVVERTTNLILELEEKLNHATSGSPWKCVLVAHGDVLQILQTGFRKMDGSLHRTLPHLETATVRDLELESDKGLCGYHALQ